MLPRLTRAIPLALLLAGSAFAPTARAEPTAADRESARTVMKEGDAAMARKDFVAARRAYEEAHRVMNVPSTGRELARAEEALGHLLEAKDVCFRVTRLPVMPGEPAPFEVARKECEAATASLDKRLATIRLTVKGLSPDTVKLSLDGASVPGPTATRRVNPGTHEVFAAGPGLASQTKSVIVAEGQTKDVILEMVGDTGAVAAPRPVSTAPVTEPTGPIPDSSGGPPPPPPPLVTGRSSHTAAYALIAGGGALAIIGGVAGVSALSDNTAAEDACPTRKGCSKDSVEKRDSAGTKAWIANGGIGLGVVLGVVGTYLLVSKPSSQSAAAAPARFYSPVLLPGGAGASLGGSF